MTFTTAAILLSSTMALALPQSAAQPAAKSPSSPAAQSAPAASKPIPQAKTKPEFDAYKVAAVETDPAKSEAAATEFAQKFPDSELRSILFQRTMGLYQQVNNSGKTLEMARASLKYEPTNPVALLTAAQILAERTHNEDLDRNERLAEASSDAALALQHTGDIPPPANFTAEQLASAVAMLRGTAHEVFATVAFKKNDYPTAIKEYQSAIADEKDHADPVVWLRLAVAYDKNNDYLSGLDAIQKAIDTSDPGSQIRTVAEQEKSRLDELTPIKPAK
jgi:tetratricopeptide (TPR) repeat protein